MRTLADIVGILLIVLGTLAIFAGCGLSAVSPGGSVLLWAGVAMVAVGLVFTNAAGKKTCPACAETVKYNAFKCKHCGFDFASEGKKAPGPTDPNALPHESGRLLGG